jgi:hypothetical protein
MDGFQRALEDVVHIENVMASTIEGSPCIYVIRIWTVADLERIFAVRGTCANCSPSSFSPLFLESHLWPLINSLMIAPRLEDH